jgi:hypothetical protein
VIHKLKAFGFIAMVGVVLISCSSEDKSETAATLAPYDDLWTNVFSKQCGTCHGPGTDSKTAGGPDLRTSEKFYEQLVGKTGDDYPDWDTYQKNRADCLSFNFIKASSAAESVVMAILDTSVSLDGCTIKSHLDAPQSVSISDAYKTKLKTWINDGAKK